LSKLFELDFGLFTSNWQHCILTLEAQ